MRKNLANILFNERFFLLYSVHVVFGEVVTGQEVVSHIEGLPVDRMSRPLQDAKVVNCGELVLKAKGKGDYEISMEKI